MKNIQKEDFDIYKALLPYCKKMLSASSEQPREIDFITLERDLELFHESQRKVCQEIVDVVDQHLEEFYDISKKMESIQDLLSTTDELYSKINNNVGSLRGNLLEQQSKLKVSLETYELKQLQASLLQQSREAFQFLILFNERFEEIKEKDYGHLSKRDKNLLIKFSYKLGYMRKILSHHFIRKHLRGEDEIETLESLELEFQTYISQQLIRLVQEKDYSMDECNIRVCYQYLNKEETYFGIIEEHLVWNQLRVVEAQLLSNKTAIISSKDPQLLQSFFKNLFMLISQLPKGFPKKRTIGFLKDFLNKKQFNFLYTYTLPVFPIAFKAFCQNIHFLNNESMQRQILKSHKWNIKMWADVKSQDILRKSQDDDLIKWLETIFQKDNILQGIQAKVIKTALLLIGRYCFQTKDIKCSQTEYSQTLSNLIEYSLKVPGILQGHLSQLGIESSMSKEIVSQIEGKFKECIDEFLGVNIQMVISSTVSTLCNVSSFLNKVLHSNQTQIHPPSMVFKAMNAHIRNYPQLSEQAQRAIRKHIMRELEEKYEKLKEQTVEYSAINMTEEQRARISKALEKDRIKLFQGEGN